MNASRTLLGVRLDTQHPRGFRAAEQGIGDSE